MAWSLPQLADRASISKGYLWQLENERHAKPSMEVLLRIAAALDMTIPPLLGQPGMTATWETPLPEYLHLSQKEFLSERRRGGRAVPPEDVRVLHSTQRQSESWGAGHAFRIEAMSLGSAAGVGTIMPGRIVPSR